MRFVANGPLIPDELLVARDEGRVVFFCGAGVSRARAGLDDFPNLIKKTTKALGVFDNDQIIKILDLLDQNAEVTGLIAIDRIFGLLEQQFSQGDIAKVVANLLKPKDGVDLSAHKILLDLAKTPDNKIRIVTTNFDLLFEASTTVSRQNIWDTWAHKLSETFAS